MDQPGLSSEGMTFMPAYYTIVGAPTKRPREREIKSLALAN